MFACGWPVPRQQFAGTYIPPPLNNAQDGAQPVQVRRMTRKYKLDLVLEWQKSDKSRPKNAKVLKHTQISKSESQMAGYLGFRRIIDFLVWCDDKGTAYWSLAQQGSFNY